VYCNHDYEPYAIIRDEKIRALLDEKNIRFLTFKDQVIFEKDEILKPDGNPYTIFTPYSKVWKSRFTQDSVEEYSLNLNNLLCGVSSGIPTLESIGFQDISFDFPSIEIPESRIFAYGKTRDIPSVQGTSGLSTQLRFGTISIRKLVKIAAGMNETFLNELIWREFFMSILFQFPHVVTQSFKPKYDRIQWLNREQDFSAWKEGRTGIPLVDAGMRELNQTGLMHNRVRMVTASFLCKHLLVDWRLGEAYFASKLLDYELSSNNGNWQWAAGTGCDAAPYFRVFNPILQQEKFDPEFRYVKNWIPEFNTKSYPEPIVNLKEAKDRCLTAYKKAINQD
jgi:deoxyribodipyrimidine photo-lyase